MVWGRGGFGNIIHEVRMTRYAGFVNMMDEIPVASGHPLQDAR
jgi:hypothetical protein